MKGEFSPFAEKTYIKKDAIFARLVTEDGYDGTVVTYLSVIMPALQTLAKCLFKDQIDGGLHTNGTEQKKLQTV